MTDAGQGLALKGADEVGGAQEDTTTDKPQTQGGPTDFLPLSSNSKRNRYSARHGQKARLYSVHLPSRDVSIVY